MSFRILIADDSSSMRKVLKKAVSMCGIHEVEFLEANNGQEALELTKKEWIDLIFTDINMPEMDGLTFIEQMHTLDLLTHTPIIIITSETRPEEIARLKQSRANDLISKPFRVEEIQSVLTGIFGEEIFNHESDKEFEGCDF